MSPTDLVNLCDKYHTLFLGCSTDERYFHDREWIKCLHCKLSKPISSGKTFQEILAANNSCKRCGNEGLMRDVLAEKKAKSRYAEYEALKAEFIDLDQHLYPITKWKFHEYKYGCPDCGCTEYCIAFVIFTTKLFTNSHLVGCIDCCTIYNWPVVDIRKLEEPGEMPIETAAQVEKRLRKARDAQLEEAFGWN